MHSYVNGVCSTWRGSRQGQWCQRPHRHPAVERLRSKTLRRQRLERTRVPTNAATVDAAFRLWPTRRSVLHRHGTFRPGLPSKATRWVVVGWSRGGLLYRFAATALNSAGESLQCLGHVGRCAVPLCCVHGMHLPPPPMRCCAALQVRHHPGGRWHRAFPAPWAANLEGKT